MRPTLMRTATTAALAITLALGSLAMTASAQTGYAGATSDGTLLSVSARGTASRAPDIATASAGVVTQAPDANAAMRANAAQMTRVIAAIRAAGIAEKDIQTSGININPDYRHVENQAPVISGYSASNTVSLKVRDIATLGEVLDALVASGANNVNGPGFGIDQPEVVYDEARRKALELARARADMYAQALDLRVRRIVSISEGGSIPQPRPMYAMRAVAMDAESTPVAPGENTLEANLEVVFELGR
ncbi:SIMPL domain-containing protein [Luteimonas sp. MJ174]|uniref:SIMPL domain-containing protein n=1 Tax=Luteimonas sp. MJ174 TaxID=3129237 RepID=UPI0031BADB2A